MGKLKKIEDIDFKNTSVTNTYGDDNLTKGFTEAESKAQQAFEAQLLYTAEMITRMIPEHRHYTDDCGDYLAAALSVSSALQYARLNGLEDLILRLQEFNSPANGYEGEDIREIDQEACDGVAPGLMDYLNSLSKEG